MKKNNGLIISTVIIMLNTAFAGLIFSQAAAFTSPRKGDTITFRRDFVVSLEIENFDKTTGHHWVAIATVTGAANWERVVELYNSDQADKSEIKDLISKWQIDQFWPKFYVPGSPHQGRVFDGGQNPLKGLEPQPMILLILKVDDAMQNYIRKWFRDGAAGKGYPGMPASKLTQNMILARCEIFFP